MKVKKKLNPIQLILFVMVLALIVGFVCFNGFNDESTSNLKRTKDYVEIINKFYAEHKENGECRYLLYDINNDDIPELFLNDSYRNTMVYTFSEDRVVFLGETYNELYKTVDNIGVISFGGLGTGIGGATLYQIENSSFKEEIILMYNAILPCNPTVYELKGKQITQDQYEEAELKMKAIPVLMYNLSKEITEKEIKQR